MQPLQRLDNVAAMAGRFGVGELVAKPDTGLEYPWPSSSENCP